MRVVVLVDGEHYPPVTRAAIDQVRADGDDVVGAVFLGGTEKVGVTDLAEVFGIPVARGKDRGAALAQALAEHRPDAVLDLSDDPVVTASERFRLAAIALIRGVGYIGADFKLDPPIFEQILTKPTIRVLATGKRTGKTAVAGALARHAVARGHQPVIVAMGRGGPPDPVVIEVGADLTPRALLELADRGQHAASDYIEDAVTSRVTTIGCRRVGGGLAGAVFRSNVAEGARIAEERREDLVILEGSGAAIPPVEADAGLVCVPATAQPEQVLEYLGPYRLLLADVAVVTMAEEADAVDQIEAAIREVTSEIEIVRTVFRPNPLEKIAGRRVFFCTTAPAGVTEVLADHLEGVHEGEVVGVSHELSDRHKLERDLQNAPGFDVLVTELKAGAVEVAVRAALDAGVEVVFADNELVGDGVTEAFDHLLELVKKNG